MVDIQEILTDSLKIGGGFAAAGFAGRYIENKVLTTPVEASSTITDKIIGWAANNAPKIVAYIALGASKTTASGTTKDIASGILGSAVVDSMLRYVNNGPNPVNITLFNYRVMNNDTQKLIQENSVMRTQLSNTLHKISDMSNPMKTENVQTLNTSEESNTAIPSIKSARNTGELLNTPISTAAMFGMY